MGVENVKQIDQIVEMSNDYFDSNYEFLEFLETLKNQILEKPKIVASWLDVEIFSLRARLVDDRICPECGARLEAVEKEGGHTNYVPYGNTYVAESTECILVCESCGEEFKYR